MIVMVVTVSAMKDTLVQIVKDAPMDTLMMGDVDYATVTLTILNLTAYLLAATARVLEGQANLMARELAKITVSPSLLIDMECQPFLHVCFTVLPQSKPLIWRFFLFFVHQHHMVCMLAPLAPTHPISLIFNLFPLPPSTPTECT